MTFQKKLLISTAALFLLGLACTLPAQFTERARPPEDIPATKIALISRNHQLAAEAYTKIERLPSYRLVSSYSLADANGTLASVSLTKEIDSVRNAHTWWVSAAGHTTELYFIDGHSYQFDPDSGGWVDLGGLSPEEVYRQQSDFETRFGAFENPAPLLGQFGVVPSLVNQATWANRPAQQYELEPLTTELAAAFDQPAAEFPLELSGSLWIDEATGALLKSEITLHDPQTRQARQQHRLEISEIGTIGPITLPGPVADPAASVAATATAQVWTILEGVLNFRGTPLTFELIPLTVRQLDNSSPLVAEVQVIIRQLPDYLGQAGTVDPFLAQLRQQLRLSIPQRNLIITSSGYQLVQQNTAEKSLEVTFSFNADLETFDRVEFMFAGQGNPQFAPVPVE